MANVSHFCTRPTDRITPVLLILSHKKHSPSPELQVNWTTYRSAALTTLGALIAGTSFLAFPVITGAFWPLSTAAYASDAGGDAPLIHDSSLPLLEAAVNTDPNPTKGGDDLSMTDGSVLVASAGPDGTPSAAAESDAPSTGDADNTIASYTVKEGDSISTIADSFGVSVNTILWANNLTSKSTIKPGMTLIVLPVSGVQHTVQKGETLASIAKKYTADPAEIATFNGIDTSSLTAGTVIIIPGGKLAAATPTTSTKTTKKVSTAKSPAVPSGLSSGGGAALSGFWTNPLPGGILTQGIHDNNAVDIGAPAGTPIYAAAGGKVIFISDNGSYNHGWGNDVIINHSNGTQTLYAHMSRVAAAVGDSVNGGTLIGYVGRTGLATGNHLHFEVHGARNPFAGCTLMKTCSPD